MSSIPRVLVLMSTYNGGKYLKQQIDSILLSAGVIVNILVRDDCSSDATMKILNGYACRGCLKIVEGSRNIGPAQSFRYLIDNCELGYDAYAYADQDDVWDKNKLYAAVGALKNDGNKLPVLWFSGIQSFSVNGEGSFFFCSEKRANSFEAVVNTFGTTNGCSMVFNEKLLLCLRSCETGIIDMHDSWTHAMCLACGGKILRDSNVYVKYRIHEQQVLGSGDNIVKKVRRFLRPSRKRSETVKVMLTSGEIKTDYAEYLALLSDYAILGKRIRILMRKCPIGMNKIENIKFKVQILLGRY